MTCSGTCTAAELTPWSSPCATTFVTLQPSFAPHQSATKSVWLGLTQLSAVPTMQTSGVLALPSMVRLARTLFVRPRPFPILSSPAACEASVMTPATKGKSAATAADPTHSTEGHGCMMRPQPSIAAAPPILQPSATIAAPGCKRDTSSVARRNALTTNNVDSSSKHRNPASKRACKGLSYGSHRLKDRDAPATLAFPADHWG